MVVQGATLFEAERLIFDLQVQVPLETPLLVSTALTIDPSLRYAPGAFTTLVAVFGLLAYGFWISLAGRMAALRSHSQGRRGSSLTAYRPKRHPIV